jgi:hypothetical protein
VITPLLPTLFTPAADGGLHLNPDYLTAVTISRCPSRCSMPPAVVEILPLCSRLRASRC